MIPMVPLLKRETRYHTFLLTAPQRFLFESISINGITKPLVIAELISIYIFSCMDTELATNEDLFPFTFLNQFYIKLDKISLS